MISSAEFFADSYERNAHHIGYKIHTYLAGFGELFVLLFAEHIRFAYLIKIADAVYYIVDFKVFLYFARRLF